MDRVSQALLGHLHGVFDPDPAPVLALRVRHEDGATWTVAGDTLTLQAGDESSTWDLNDYHLASLATALTAAGYEVAYLNPAVSHLSALTLLEGVGDQDVSNGDHLSIYTAPLAILLAALGQALGEGRAAIAAALAQLVIPNATQEWADLFGELFAIPRRGTIADSPYLRLADLVAHHNPSGTTDHAYTLNAAWETFFGNLLGLPRAAGESAAHYHDRLVYAAQQRSIEPLPALETDTDYTARIVQEVQRVRSSPAAMLRNIRRLTGHDLALWEPWRELHVVSQSPLSGTDHLQGAPIYEYHRIQLVARSGIDWTPVLREAEADRPAGTLMLPPATQMPVLYVAEVGLTPNLGQIGRWAEELKWNVYGRLSIDLRPSHYLPSPMTALGHVEVRGLGTHGLRGPYEYFGDSSLSWIGLWDSRTWATGNTAMPELYPPKTLES
jgi:hypothetical protein